MTKTNEKTSSKKTALQKREERIQLAAKRQARKVTLRASKKKAVKEEDSSKRVKFKPERHAPAAARMTPPKGPMKAVASKTRFAPTVNSEREWLLVDAAGKTVGRLASSIAKVLRGKTKASYTPNNDVGDFVVVVNAEKLKFTKNKEEQKNYYNYTGWIGGMKVTPAPEMREKKPEEILRRAVDRMIPRTPLGRNQAAKLKIYAGLNHPHSAQAPRAVESL